MYAHYFVKGKSKLLLITNSNDLSKATKSERITVEGIAEARRKARSKGAICWNF